MADLTRTPKLVSAWTPHELCAFNISSTKSTYETFFGIQELPPFVSTPDDPQTMLFPEHFGSRSALFESTGKFLEALENCRPSARGGGRIVAIEEFLSQAFGMQLRFYDGGPETDIQRVLNRRYRLWLRMCGKDVCATSKLFLQRRWSHDVSIRKKPQVILNLVAPRRATEPVPSRNSLPRLVGSALAAFGLLNEARVQLGEKELESWTFLAISFHYTAPTFYKIPITAELVEHVANGTYPTTETIVEELILDLPDPKRAREGFGPLENREMLVRYCRAFKDLMDAQSLESYEGLEQLAVESH
ncbi:hypothetical protein C8Q76DRAFT_795476 [Earliella scabrosa]|nr:hypothetical protein C8Q76DRAFT_795476 [Earliella scabrosa]